MPINLTIVYTCDTCYRTRRGSQIPNGWVASISHPTFTITCPVCHYKKEKVRLVKLKALADTELAYEKWRDSLPTKTKGVPKEVIDE